jgi:hypothetical protein
VRGSVKYSIRNGGEKRIHFHKKTSVGGDESLSFPIDLKLILFFLLFFGKKTSQKRDLLLLGLYLKLKEDASNLHAFEPFM